MDEIGFRQTRLSELIFKKAIEYLTGKSDKRIIINQGGTYSGKTAAISQVIAWLAIEGGKDRLITVVAQDYPNLRDGALRSWNDHVVQEPAFNQGIKNYRKGDRTFEFIGGSEVQFKTYQDGQDAKGGKRWGLFINEADGEKWEVADELIRRTEGLIFIDYNPTGEFWVHSELLGRDDVVFIQSDYTWNEFCPEVTIKEILSYKEKGYINPDLENYDRPDNIKNQYWANRWRVYGEGNLGVAYDLVFPNSERFYHEFPTDAKRVGYTMDLGFSNDPTTLIKTGIVGDAIYSECLLYKPGMTTQDIRDYLVDIEVTNNIKIDGGAGGDRVAAELRRAGIGISVIKKETISEGIEKINRYKLYIKGEDYWNERKAYKYKKDRRTGELTNTPIEGNDHCFDALRYWAVNNVKLRSVRRKYKVYI